MTTQSFYGVNLARAERLADSVGRLVAVNVSAASLWSAQVEIVSGSFASASIAFRKTNAPGAIGVDYSTAVTLAAAGMTTLQVCESEYVQAENTVANGSALVVNIHFHLRDTPGVTA